MMMQLGLLCRQLWLVIMDSSLLQIVLAFVMFCELCVMDTMAFCPDFCQCPSSNWTVCRAQNFTIVPSIPSQLQTQLFILDLSYNLIFQLTNSSFSSLPYIHEIYIDYNKIGMIEVGAFAKMWNLQVLSLRGNQLTSLEATVLKDLVSLKHLDLGANLLHALHSDVFYQMANLRVVNLGNNQVMEIQNGTFRTLSRLHTLNLSQNPLKKLDTRLFYPLTNLTFLGISKIGIKDIAKELLKNNKHLYSLDLSYNRLSGVPLSLVSDLTNLHYFNISGNPLYCNCHLRPLREWMASNIALVWTALNSPKCLYPQEYRASPVHQIPPNDFNCSAQAQYNLTKNSQQARSGSVHEATVAKDELPYNAYMGWYTAATLSAMLILFLICLGLDKLKRNFYKKRRARREKKEKYEYSPAAVEEQKNTSKRSDSGAALSPSAADTVIPNEGAGARCEDNRLTLPNCDHLGCPATGSNPTELKELEFITQNLCPKHALALQASSHDVHPDVHIETVL